jgi:hypothetical protein
LRKILLFTFYICLLSEPAVYASGEAGAAAGNSILTQLRSADNINQRLIQPMTSADTSMQTFNTEGDQRSFDAQLDGPSSNVFLEISGDAAPTGDLTVTVRQDRDFDGAIDNVINLPMSISGVCRNGIISCTAGTWNNCAYYSWVTDNYLHISVNQEASITDLSDCYCINSSCYSHIVETNMGSVLEDIGTGIVEAMQTTNPSCAVTNVVAEGSTVIYYGMLTREIGSDVDGLYHVENSNLEEYYQGGMGELPVDEEVQRQQNDPDSYYSLLMDGANNIPNTEMYECTITNDVLITENNGSIEIQVTNENGCNPADNCSLRQEMVCGPADDCIYTWRLHNMIDVPSESCRESQIGGYNYTACMDGTNISLSTNGSTPQILFSGSDTWWRIERLYICTEEHQYDFSSALEQMGHAENTTEINGNTLHYERLDPETGETTSREVTIPKMPEYPDCTAACKVRKPVENTRSGEAGTTTDYRVTNQSYLYSYKECLNGVCPAEDDETIVKDCGCLDEYAEAATAMETMKQVADDNSCAEYNSDGMCILLYVFGGDAERCRRSGVTTGGSNCCNDDDTWLGFGDCRQSEQDLATQKTNGFCHEVGEYCSQEVDLLFGSMCVEHSRSYCCFHSKLARIIHEQGRPQFITDINNWGSPENPNCRGFTIEEFQMLDFSTMDMSEWHEEVAEGAQARIDRFYDELDSGSDL